MGGGGWEMVVRGILPSAALVQNDRVGGVL